MTNRNKSRGTAWETAVAKHAQSRGFPYCERRALAGNTDKGDLTLCPGVIIECKDWAAYNDGNVTEWWRETLAEKKNANASVALLVVKRSYQPAGKAWCWVQGEWGYWSAYRLDDALDMLRDQGWGSAREL
jgi:hypothetical protein